MLMMINQRKKHAKRFDNDQQADNTNMILQRGFGSLFYTHNDDHNDNHMHGTQQKNSRKKNSKIGGVLILLALQCNKEFYYSAFFYGTIPA